MKLVVNQSQKEVDDYKRGEQYAPFECKECGYRAYISIFMAESHEEKCKGRKPKVTKKPKVSRPSAQNHP